MANEITTGVSLDFSKNGSDISVSIGSIQIDVSGDSVVHNIQNIATSEEALVMGDVSTPGLFVARNLDATNYVELRAATGVADLVRLNAGECCLFRLAADATAPFAIANTAAVNLEYWLFET